MNKKKFAVLGFPIQHSLSPLIHNSFAKQINVDISYSKIKVDLKKFKEVVIQLRDEKFTGVNVTVPLKFEALKVSTSSSDNSKISKAANCLSFKNNKIIHAENTDGFGLVKDLSNKKIDLVNRKILIIGAGGATSGALPSLIK
jgi:shikimate dehydrogenase